MECNEMSDHYICFFMFACLKDGLCLKEIFSYSSIFDFYLSINMAVFAYLGEPDGRGYF